MSKKLDVNWERQAGTEDFKPALKHYVRYLQDSGLSESTITSYVFRVGKFLEYARDDTPREEDFMRFPDSLHEN